MQKFASLTYVFVVKKIEALLKKVIYQPLAFEIQGSSGPSTGEFLKDLCKLLCIMNNEPIAGSFLKQRFSLAIQTANAACELGTTNNKTTLDEIFCL